MREMLAPLTRLSVTDVLSGWAKVTCASLPMSKPCQLMMARWVSCVMSMRVPLLVMTGLAG